ANGMMNNVPDLNKLDPAMLNQIASQLGISSEQALQLKNQLSASGKLTNDQILELKSRIATVAPQEKTQPPEARPQMGETQLPQPPSNIETRFRATDTPGILPEAPV